MKKILFAASECVPFIKTGGLADVVGSLPKNFNKEEFDVRVILPKYACIKQEWADKLEYVTNFSMDYNWKSRYVGIFKYELDGITYYFIDNEEYFNGAKPYDGGLWDIEKFGYFSKAVLRALPEIDFKPDVIHCHDWQTGLIPYIKKANYFAFSMISTTRHLFVLERGLVSIILTLSPTPQVLLSSCA